MVGAATVICTYPVASFFLRLQVALMQGGAAECTWLGSGSS